MLLVVRLMIRQQLYYESIMGCFSLLVSFMYHTCECFNTVLILPEIKWHRLDNIGAITAISCTCLHLACFERKELCDCLQYIALFLVIILQEISPWDIRYTVWPVLAVICIPLLSHWLYPPRRAFLMMNRLLLGLAAAAVAFFFFGLGLNDRQDPFRIFHGLFHVFIALTVLLLLSSIRRSSRKYVRPLSLPRTPDTIQIPINI